MERYFGFNPKIELKEMVDPYENIFEFISPEKVDMGC